MENKVFKKLNELNNEDCKNLEVVKVELRHNVSKDYGHTYSCEMLVGPYHVKFRKNFSELNYYSILIAQKDIKEGSLVTVNAYRRWTKGMAKNGKEYHQVQLIFGKDTFLTRMISDSELSLFNDFIKRKMIKEIEWVEVPANIGVDEEVISLDE